MKISLDRAVEHGAASIQIPKSTIRVMELTQDPDTPIETLAEAIQTDAALAARVLSVANSPAYATQRNIADINGAVMWMGFREIARIAIAVGALSEISRVQTSLLEMADFHRHSVQAAALCDRLSQKYGYGRDTGFTAGLLHDIGLLVMFSACEDQMMQVLERSLYDDSMPLQMFEKEILGFDHTEVGGRLAERWGLPDPIVKAIRHHHDLACEFDFKHEVAIVAYANHLLTSLDGNAQGGWPETLDDPMEEVAALLSIDPEGDDELVELATADAERLVPSETPSDSAAQAAG